MEVSTDIKRTATSPLWKGFRKSLPGYAFILPLLVLFLFFRGVASDQRAVAQLPGIPNSGRFDVGWARPFPVSVAGRSVLAQPAGDRHLRPDLGAPVDGLGPRSRAPDQPGNPGYSFYRAIYFLPYITSFVMVAVIWSWVYRTNGGLLNGLLGTVSLGPVKWLTSNEMVIPSLAIMATWKGVGYAMMILLAGLQGDPRRGGRSIVGRRRYSLPDVLANNVAPAQACVVLCRRD